jgi:hypothetical protein
MLCALVDEEQQALLLRGEGGGERVVAFLGQGGGVL